MDLFDLVVVVFIGVARFLIGGGGSCHNLSIANPKTGYSLSAAAAKIPLHFAVKDVAKIVQYPFYV